MPKKVFLQLALADRLRTICPKVVRCVLLCLSVICLAAYGASASAGQEARVEDLNLERTQLENERLALEVERLRQEQQYSTLARAVPILTGIVGAVAVVWTIIQGMRTLRYQSDTLRHQTDTQEETFRQQAETQKAQRVAELLSALSENEEGKRLGAARGLTRYADEVVTEALSALSQEQAPSVRSTLEDVLYDVKDSKRIDDIYASNAGTLRERAYLSGKLRKAGATAEFEGAVLRLSFFAVAASKKRYKWQFDHGKLSQAYEAQRTRALQKPESDGNLLLVAACGQAVLLAESTGRVVARLLKDGRKPARLDSRGSGYALDLTSADLYRVDLSRLCLSGSLMANCVMRHARLDNSVAVDCDLSDSDLYDASLQETVLAGANLTGAHLRHSKGQKAKLREATLLNTVFSEGDFQHADFGKVVDATGAKFRETDLRNACFELGFFKGVDFSRAKLQSAKAEGAEFYASAFHQADLTDACLTEAKFGGAKLQGAIFRNADLRNADLSGANIKGADFRGAKIQGVKLRKAKNVDSAYWGQITEEGDL